MSSYRQILYHLVFATKHRAPTLPEVHHLSLYRYTWGIVRGCQSTLFQINGTADHVHLLLDLHPSIALADLVKKIKVASHLWMKESGHFPSFAGWQEGYGAFTHSIGEKERLIQYIKQQKVHHRQISFLDEYRNLLVEQGVSFDERYLAK